MIDRIPLPAVAAWLGYGGLLPFAVAALALWLTEGGVQRFAAVAMLAYGGAILSFLGGIQWGLGSTLGASAVGRRLAWSVLPSLWAATAMALGLVLQPRVGLALLALGLAAWWVLEAYRLPSAPVAPWYPRLRRHLTAGAVLCLSLGAAAPFAAS
jgi:hypothetical protein